jgi:hypothetical protein
MKKRYVIPRPVVNKKENKSLEELTQEYEELIAPGKIAKAGEKVNELIPKPVKNAIKQAKENISEAELYAQCMKIVAKGFNEIEKNAAKMTVSEKKVVGQVDKVTKYNDITRLEEVCLARGYDVSKLVSTYKTKDLMLALIEGGTTGFFGFAGIPFNLVLSLFIYYRAVQSVAMYYGYDIKNNPAEMIIASDVLMKAFSPKSKGPDEISGIIGKVMLITETTVVKQTVNKSWKAMAEKGGICLLVTQMRALANAAARKALEEAGKKGLEKTVFTGVFEQIGKKLTQKAVGKMAPVVGGVIGGLFDYAQMSTIIDYADIFYHKRFIIEKEVRINSLVFADSDDVIDINPDDLKKL